MQTFLKRYFEKLIVKTMLLTMGSCFVAGLALFYFHTIAQEEMLSTEVSHRSEAVGYSVVRVIESALRIGIPLEDMVDMTDYLTGNMKNSAEISYLSLTNLDGNVLYNSAGFENAVKGAFKRFALGSYDHQEHLPAFDISNKYTNIPLRINEDKNLLGFLHVGISKKATLNRIDDIYYDILTLLFVSMVIGYEFFIFIFRNRVSRSLSVMVETMKRVINHDYTRTSLKHTQDSVGDFIDKLNKLILHTSDKFYAISKFSAKSSNTKTDHYLHISETLIEETTNKQFPTADKPTQDIPTPIVLNLRLPAFLLVLAETILVSILPSFASQFYNPSYGVSQQFVSGSPILIFMLFSGLSIPFSNRISYRIGFQKTLILGLVIFSLGHILACFTFSLFWLLMTRAITAFGYGLAYISCQNYIAAYAPPNDRIRSYAIFAIAFGAAYICGAPIGGILVENVGYNMTFSVAAFSSLFCIHIVRKYIVDFSSITLRKMRMTKKTTRDLIKNVPLALSVIFTGLPARMIFSSLVCFLYPLYLRFLGNSQASVGRIIMIYGIVSFIFSPFAAAVVERIQSARYVLIMSAFIIAGALALSAFSGNVLGASVALGLYTIGAVLQTCGMMALLEKISEIEYHNHTKGSILSFYFIFERVGMVIGPALFSVILARFGFQETLYIMAVTVFICALIFWIGSMSSRHYYTAVRHEDSSL